MSGLYTGFKKCEAFQDLDFRFQVVAPNHPAGGGSWKRNGETARLSHVESRQNFFSESLESLWDHQHTKPISLEGSRPPTSEMNEEGKPWSRVVAMGKQMEEMEVTGSHLKLRLEVPTALVVNLLVEKC